MRYVPSKQQSKSRYPNAERANRHHPRSRPSPSRESRWQEPGWDPWKCLIVKWTYAKTKTNDGSRLEHIGTICWKITIGLHNGIIVDVPFAIAMSVYCGGQPKSSWLWTLFFGMSHPLWSTAAFAPIHQYPRCHSHAELIAGDVEPVFRIKDLQPCTQDVGLYLRRRQEAWSMATHPKNTKSPQPAAFWGCKHLWVPQAISRRTCQFEAFDRVPHGMS